MKNTDPPTYSCSSAADGRTFTNATSIPLYRSPVRGLEKTSPESEPS